MRAEELLSGKAMRPILRAERPVCDACGMRTQGWLWFAFCSCGRGSHGVCLECLESAAEIDLIEVRRTIVENDMEAGPPVRRENRSYYLRRCLDLEEVRTALAMGR